MGLQQHLDRATTYRTAVDEVADPLAQTARLSYEEGEIGILELLDAERQLVEADLRAINLALAARQAAKHAHHGPPPCGVTTSPAASAVRTDRYTAASARRRSADRLSNERSGSRIRWIGSSRSRCRSRNAQ